MNIARVFTALKNHSVVTATDSAQPTPKTYTRMDRIALTESHPTASLIHAFQTRKSIASIHNTKKHITVDDLSVLFSGIRAQSSHHRPYPSGGGLYPIEIYIYTCGISSMTNGYHHYHATDHALEFLWDAQPPYAHAHTPRVDIILTSIWQRQAEKYHLRALPLALLEAGHVAQNILLAGATVDIQFRPWLGFDGEQIEHALELPHQQESVLYTLRSLP